MDDLLYNFFYDSAGLVGPRKPFFGGLGFGFLGGRFGFTLHSGGREWGHLVEEDVWVCAFF